MEDQEKFILGWEENVFNTHPRQQSVQTRERNNRFLGSLYRFLDEVPDSSRCIFELPKYSEIEQTIDSLPLNKATGPDMLKAALIKFASDSLKNKIHILIKNIVMTAKIPDEMNSVLIFPIYKQGDKNKWSSWRPISLTNIIWKILDKWLASKI